MFSLLIPNLLSIALFFALFLALFILSVFADRVLHAETLAKWSFGLSSMLLWLAMALLMFDLFLGTPPYEELASGPIIINVLKWMASGFGGWSMMFAAVYFSGAMVFGVVFLLARFVDAVEKWWYGFAALCGLVCGIVFLVGFFVFFEGLALILGLVATIIGILVGLIKLASRNTG